ncbi:outer membrane protein [Bartonella refiksaydamii]|uniref:outer membrane protein n=1 Tax=Bartonella refiksaydamii TaxID=2654951 RepID=UPI0012EBEBC7|nr:outer membrane protein [Bartonella refiksaydamii]
MITKYLITTSIFSLTLVSAIQAADVTIPEQPVPVVASPAFSWTGVYLGSKIGGFSSKNTLSYLKDESNTEKWTPVDKEFLPKLSGFIGGIYAGFNIDIENGFIIGIDTDVILSDKKDTKDVKPPSEKKNRVVSEDAEGVALRAIYQREEEVAVTKSVQHTLKQKWSGAARVRVGFAIDRMMPYIAGGIAYAQLQNTFKLKEADTKNRAMGFSESLHDEKKTMVGYTLGGGVDFAMTDNIIMRAEYRYSDFGKKKFAHERTELGYKTNDFRVGVAYKF